MSDTARIRVSLLEPDRAVAGPLSQALSTEPGLELVAGAIGERAADVVIVDTAGAGKDPAAFVRDILARRPGTCVIATGRATPAGTVGRIIAAGAATFLPKPYLADELIAMVRELRGAPARPAAAPLGGGRQRRGAIVAVYSPKGGVGTTTIATSLAVALSGVNTRVAIVDLDLQFGDVGVALDLKGASGIADLLSGDGPIDEAVLSDVFVRHSSGVHALLAPEDPTDMGSVDVPEVMRLLDRLRPTFDYIVCDLWSSLEELALSTLRAADRVVLVTTPEVPSLRHVRRVLNATGPLLASDRTFVVANRAPSKVGLSQPEMERALGMPVAASIPSEGIGVTKAINEGMSILDPRANLRIARPVRELADLLTKDITQRRETAGSATPAVVPS